jgi:CHAT domain-containing protein/tetratricopeptide (TPR) repeat protein
VRALALCILCGLLLVPDARAQEDPRAHVRAGLQATREGRHADALAAFQAALALLPEGQAPAGQRAMCLYSVGDAQVHLGHPQEALAPLKQALELYRALPDSGWEQAECLRLSAQAHDGLGNSPAALAAYQEALGLYRKVADTEDAQAECLLAIGTLLGAQGRWQEEIQHVEEALGFWQRLPDTQARRAVCLQNLAVATGALGDQARKLDLAVQALDLFRAVRGTERQQADCLQSMGAAASRLGMPERAKEYTTEALALLRALPGTEHKQADCLINLSVACGDMDDREGELGALRDAGRLLEGLPEACTSLAACLLNLGVALLRWDTAAAALEPLRQAEDAFRQVARRAPLGARVPPPELYRAEAALGQACRLCDPPDYPRAYRHFARATQLVEQARPLGATDPGLRATHFGQAHWVYQQMLELLVDMRRAGSRPNASQMKEAEPEFWQDLGLPVPDLWPGWESLDDAILFYSEASRARVLRDLLAAAPVRLADPQAQRLWEDFSLASSRERAALSALQEAAGASETRHAELGRMLAEASADRRRAQMAWSATAVGRLVQPPAVSLSQLRAVLKPGEAMLELSILDRRLLALVVTPRATVIRVTDLPGPFTEAQRGPPDLLPPLERLAAWQRQAADAQGLPPGAPGALTPDDFRAHFALPELVWLYHVPMYALGGILEDRLRGQEAARWQMPLAAALYDLLLRPVEADLARARVRTLYVVPDGALHYLPFAALVSARPQASSAPLTSLWAAPQARFALDRWDIAQLPSAAALLRQARATPTRALCALADAQVTPRLPGTRAEALQALRTLQPPELEVTEHPSGRWPPGLVLLGPAACEEALFAPQMRRYPYVLVATHAVIEPAAPTTSCIRLSPAPQAADEARRDGALTLPEVFGLQLEARLVVLSGCSTAQGAYLQGEGVLGLAAGFLTSGAQAVAASLWRVSDDSSADLVGGLFAGLARGQEPATALAAAQRTALADARRAFLRAPDSPGAAGANPYRWAPYVLLGR